MRHRRVLLPTAAPPHHPSHVFCCGSSHQEAPISPSLISFPCSSGNWAGDALDSVSSCQGPLSPRLGGGRPWEFYACMRNSPANVLSVMAREGYAQEEWPNGLAGHRGPGPLGLLVIWVWAPHGTNSPVAPPPCAFLGLPSRGMHPEGWGQPIGPRHRHRDIGATDSLLPGTEGPEPHPSPLPFSWRALPSTTI